MSLRISRFLLMAALLLLPLSAAEAAQLTHGPMVFRMLPKRATIWVRTDVAAEIDVEYSADPNFSSFATKGGITKKGRDYTAVVQLTGLVPLTTYYYRVYVGNALTGPTRYFHTAPQKGKKVSLRFAVLADSMKLQPAPVLETVVAMDPDFICFVGDLGHDDPANKNEMRISRRESRSNATPFGADFKDLLIDSNPFRQIPFYYTWDDHDYGKNNGDSTFPKKKDAVKVYKEYFYPTSGLKPGGIWQKYNYGKDTEIYLLDLRSQRDPNNTPNGPNKTMLGQAQKDWLKLNLLASKARWKLLMSSVPLNPETKPWDAWGAFPHERAEMINFINNNGISGVVVLSGDIHSGGAMDNGANSGLPEITIPHLNMTTLVDTWTFGNPPTPGTWTTGVLTGLNSPGFVLCDVTPNSIDLTIRDADGAIKRGQNGTLLRMVGGDPPPGEVGIPLED